MYKIYYPEVPNMGDLLNKDMLEEIFGITVINTNVYRSNLTAIGSGIGGRLMPTTIKGRIRVALETPFMEKKHHIWGTGFISYPTEEDRDFIYRDVEVHSLRGALTQARVEKILEKKLDVPLGDGGLLAERWIDEKISKKYTIGVIPHFKEKDHKLIEEILRFYKGSHLIDLGLKPKDVVKEIAACEYVISSSLHGLIIADSFHIPNVHMVLYEHGKRIMGDGYKFADYYSAYGLKDEFVDMDKDPWPSLSEIECGYKVDSSEVEKKKEQIYKAFPKL